MAVAKRKTYTYGKTFGNKLLNQAIGNDPNENTQPDTAPHSVDITPKKPSPEQMQEFLDEMRANQFDPTKPMSLQPAPQFTNSDGTLNPKYKSGRGEGAMAGGGEAMQYSNGNPLHDIGLALGGMLGGAINPRIAAKKKWEQDVRKVKIENDVTEAQIRLENAQKQIDIQAQRAKAYEISQQRMLQIREENAKNKDKYTRVQNNLKLYDAEQDPEVKAQIKAMLDEDGIPVGDRRSKVSIVKAGNFLLTHDGHGNFKTVENEAGIPYTDMTVDKYLKILKDINMIHKQPLTEDTIKKAQGYLEKAGVKSTAGAVVSLAKQIVESDTGNLTSFTVTLPDGSLKDVSIPLPNSAQPTPAGAAPSSDSQFMPPIDGKAPAVADATMPVTKGAKGEDIINVPVPDTDPSKQVIDTFNSKIDNPKVKAFLSAMKEGEIKSISQTVNGKKVIVKFKKEKGKLIPVNDE